MKISLVCLALNLVFALWLVRPYREAGLAVANTLSAGFNTALLLFALRKKLVRLDLAGLPQIVFTLSGAAAAAGAAAFGLYHLWDAKLGHATLLLKIGAVFVPGALAGLAYGLIAVWAKIPAAREVGNLIWQRLLGRRPR
jgi:peptidoglycan biosynthesis protein MviN/MurJ (putative lipid II flippase)